MNEHITHAVDDALVATCVPFTAAFAVAALVPPSYRSAVAVGTWFATTVFIGLIYKARMEDDARIADERAKQKLHDTLTAQNDPKFE